MYLTLVSSLTVSGIKTDSVCVFPNRKSAKKHRVEAHQNLQREGIEWFALTTLYVPRGLPFEAATFIANGTVARTEGFSLIHECKHYNQLPQEPLSENNFQREER